MAADNVTRWAVLHGSGVWARSNSLPVSFHAIRTEIGRPSSNMRVRA